MQYLLCPRCHFRAPLTKHICTTCGYSLPAVTTAKPAARESGTAASKPQQNGWFQQFLGLNAAPEEVAKDSTTEEPALS